jgi:translation initiation factor 6
LAIIEADVFGSPNIGVYCFGNENLIVVPPGLTNRKMNQLAQTLDAKLCATTIGGSTLAGALMTGNSNGVLVPHIIRDYERERIEALVEVTVVESRWTALGNVILANDFGTVVHPETPQEILEAINDQLKMKPVSARMGGLPFVGALGVATNKGAVLTPNTRNEEQSVIEAALRVDTVLSTTNGGVPFVKSGILANSKGAVVGPLTRGAELMQVSRALVL